MLCGILIGSPLVIFYDALYADHRWGTVALLTATYGIGPRSKPSAVD